MMAAWDLVQPQRSTPMVLRLFCPRQETVNQTGFATSVVAVRIQKVTADF
jgi:hypothetical protein